jgi:hypothetical protein
MKNNRNYFSKVLDSWSNFTKAFTHGNSFDFGDFDKCLSFKHEKIQPQHCLIQYQKKQRTTRKVVSVLPSKTPLNHNWKNLNRRFAGSICIPNTCTAQNVNDLMREVLNGSDFTQANDYDQSKYCQQAKASYHFDTFLIISIVCIVVIIFFIVVGTMLSSSKSPAYCIKIFQCFSIKRNFKNFVNFSSDKSQIACLNGIKSISTIGIFFFHSAAFRMVFPFSNGKNLSELTNSKFSDFVLSLLILMDTFLIISGVLVGRTLIKTEKLTLWKFYLQRYMRITSLMLVLISYGAINLLAFKFFPRPYFHLDHLMDDCRSHWWSTALHIQTYINPMDMVSVNDLLLYYKKIFFFKFF